MLWALNAIIPSNPDIILWSIIGFLLEMRKSIAQGPFARCFLPPESLFTVIVYYVCPSPEGTGGMQVSHLAKCSHLRKIGIRDSPDGNEPGQSHGTEGKDVRLGADQALGSSGTARTHPGPPRAESQSLSAELAAMPCANASDCSLATVSSTTATLPQALGLLSAAAATLQEELRLFPDQVQPSEETQHHRHLCSFPLPLSSFLLCQIPELRDLSCSAFLLLSPQVTTGLAAP